MTTLTKLGIQGIRSFSNERMESLEFERPVTLIVGHNGAGKTTVIECLKMYVFLVHAEHFTNRATCGQLPPNCDKGHGFIHDPNIAGVPEVKGQIRLLFRTGVNHQSVCATRTFQLTNTRNKGGLKSTFKAVENLIRFKDRDGDNNRGNRKCNDMDTAIPSLMGVSRPILEHVIFCHQEESNWPLGERMLLKKRFDEIFGSSRYTKALEAIDKQRKEILKEAKEKSHVLTLVSKDRDSAADLRRDEDKISKSLEGIAVRMHNLSTEIDTKEAELEALMKSEQEFKESFYRIDMVSKEIDKMKSEHFGIENSSSEAVMGKVSETQNALSELEARKSSLVSTSARTKSEFDSLLVKRNSVSAQLKQMRTENIESSNIQDLLRLKTGELDAAIAASKAAGFLPQAFVFSHSAISEMEGLVNRRISEKERQSTELMQSIKQFVADVRSAEEVYANSQKELFQINAQVQAIETQLASRNNEAAAVRQRLTVILGTCIDVSDPEFLDKGTRILSDQIQSIEQKLHTVVVKKRILSNGDLLQDIKSDIRDIIADSVSVASLMYASPFEILAFFETRAKELYCKLESVSSVASSSTHQPHVSSIKSELSLAKQALQVYNQLKSRTVADMKCGLCRQGIKSVSEFEGIFEKITRKLPLIISENELKLSQLSFSATVASDFATPSDHAIRSVIEELVGVEKTISRITSLQQVIAHLDSKIGDAASTQAEVAKVDQEEIELTTARNKLMVELENLKNLLSRSHQIAAETSSCSETLDELKQNALPRLNQRVAAQGLALQQAKDSHVSATERHGQEMSRLDSVLNHIRSAFHVIFQIATQVDSMQARAATLTLSEGQKAFARLENEEAQTEKRIAVIMSDLSRSENEKTDIELLVAQTQSELAQIKAKTRFFDLFSELTQLKSSTGEKTFCADQLQSAMNSLNARTRSLRDERAKLEGESHQLRMQLSEVKKKLSTNALINVDEKYRESFILMENHNILAKDVQRYHQALDRALMNYHVQKMNEINQVIRDLWERVYKGSDIDFIAIRSDSEEEGTDPTAATAKRSYNYRVVMVKGDVELEMRGRCSAGQKVVASLIIRLALAESFCSSCGILALDEPTTNLDRANIGGLAQALADLIESRRQQRNFQLIIITHDESFVRMLGRLRACDHFHRVSKDDHGHTTISRSAIYELNTS